MSLAIDQNLGVDFFSPDPIWSGTKNWSSESAIFFNSVSRLRSCKWQYILCTYQCRWGKSDLRAVLIAKLLLIFLVSLALCWFLLYTSTFLIALIGLLMFLLFFLRFCPLSFSFTSLSTGCFLLASCWSFAPAPASPTTPTSSCRFFLYSWCLTRFFPSIVRVIIMTTLTRISRICPGCFA